MLTVNTITLRVAGKPLLQDASLSIGPGARVGLVGQNGVGKSTLLRAINGDLAVDKGEISLPARWSMAMTQQEAPGGSLSLIDTVLNADVEVASLLKQAEALERGEALPQGQDQGGEEGDLAAIYDRLSDLDAFTARARAATILAGLGFDEAAQARACQEFSGGWRMRVALAALLFLQPDLLLLDEPTNHLDLEATIWLESYLKAYPGTLVLVSHDRGLLNRCVTQIAHLSDLRLRLYTGGYDDFERQRALQMELDAKAQAKVDAKRAHMQAFVDRFRYKDSKAKQAQSRLKMLEKLQDVAALSAERTLPITFPTPDPLASPLLTFDQAEAGYGGEPILRHINFQLNTDDRLALLGANGQGKSTLLKLIVGELQSPVGETRKSGKLRVGYFAQHQAEALTLCETPLDALGRVLPGKTETEVRKRLGGFGFSEGRATTRIGDLSGGQKARLLLALMSIDRPHVLLLDEPTNHLDVDSRQALVQAIQDFEGAVILVSHDPDLVAACADALWLVKDGRVAPYAGDLDDYRALLLGKSAPGKSKKSGGDEGSAASASTASAPSSPPAPVRQKISKQARKDLQNAVKNAEKNVDRLTAMIAKAEDRLADPELYAKDPQKLESYGILIKTLRADLAAAESAWLHAESQLEKADR